MILQAIIGKPEESHNEMEQPLKEGELVLLNLPKYAGEGKIVNVDRQTVVIQWYQGSRTLLRRPVHAQLEERAAGANRVSAL